MEFEAADKAGAIAQAKEQMTEASVREHFTTKHPGQTAPPMTDIHQMIETSMTEA